MLRILMLNNEFPPLGGGTGVANYHHLEEYSHHSDLIIDLVTSSRTKKEYEIEKFSQRITIYKVPVNNRDIHHARISELIRYLGRSIQSSIRLLKKKKYDLSIAYSGLPAGYTSYYLKKKYNLPYLVLLRGSDIPGWDRRYRLLYPFLKPFVTRIWRGASVVSAVSRGQKALAVKGCSDVPISIVTNGVNVDLFKPRNGKRGIGLINILCVGRLVKHKGQENLIEALADLRRYFAGIKLHLTLVGTGDYEEYLKQRVRIIGIREMVTFTGYVPYEDMPLHYQRADIFVLVSKNEGMSNALLEATASGLPVIVSNTGGSEEVVRDGVNGYILDNNDVSDLVKVLRLLVADHRLKQTMGNESRRIACSFSWEHECSKYLEHCRQIVRC